MHTGENEKMRRFISEILHAKVLHIALHVLVVIYVSLHLVHPQSMIADFVLVVTGVGLAFPRDFNLGSIG